MAKCAHGLCEQASDPDPISDDNTGYCKWHLMVIKELLAQDDRGEPRSERRAVGVVTIATGTVAIWAGSIPLPAQC